MVNPVPNSLEKTWEECNVQVFVVLSLFLQTFLILVAPLRKRTASLLVTALLWSAYLLADWAASFAVGLISSSSLLGSSSNKKNPSPKNGSSSSSNADILAFWAPFLLLHLGGPDTITAFSLEDNALWLRHFLSLVFQVLAAAYVLLLSLPSNSLLVPTVLVLIAGIIKYAERTRSLYLASMDIVFEEHALKGDPTHLRVREDDDEEERSPVQDASSTAINFSEESLQDHDSALVIYARNYFEIFRGFKCNFIGLSEEQFKETTCHLLMRNSERAIEMLSIELNWLYQILYTKAVVVRSKWGYILRFISFSEIVVALLVFTLLDKKKHGDFDNVNVVITYILLGGAIFLDTISFLMLIPSDWTFSELYVKRYRLGRCPGVISFIHRNYLELRRPNWSSSSRILKPFSLSSISDWARKILFRRWSESVSSYNFIEYCLRENSVWRSEHRIIDPLTNIYVKIIDFFGVKDLRDRMKYVSSQPLSKELWDFLLKEVFDYINNSAYFANIGSNVLHGTGAYTLQSRGHHGNLITHVAKLQYEASLLVWHIATEICYNTVDDSDDLNIRNGTNADQERRREFGKVLSDYMLYLLIVQPEVVSSTPDIQQERLKSTCETANWFFTSNYLGPKSELKQACRLLLEEYGKDFENAAAVEAGQAVNEVYHGSALARMLEELKENKWEAICAVWVELLAYGAYNSRPKSHARLLTGGGELISYVWLAMAHFGIARKTSEE